LVTLGLRMADQEEFRRPQNVGYGITHILPILTACLTASPGSILLIENPEAHLHPSGQSLMGAFLAKTAANGVQVVVESHSDHILNGIRIAVKNELINQNDVAIHFFTSVLETQVMSPLIDRNGNLDKWPQGFFDQIDIDTTTLLGWNNS
jgi:predicted ATPase